MGAVAEEELADVLLAVFCTKVCGPALIQAGPRGGAGFLVHMAQSPASESYTPAVLTRETVPTKAA